MSPSTPCGSDEIRSAFPALRRMFGALPVAYFDGPGGTQVPESVVTAMSAYLTAHNANTHWNYPTSEETDAMLDEARHAAADFIGSDPDEVSFGPNMTALTFHLSRALGRELGPGDEIVVTELDHHANVDPWRALAVERGVAISTVRVDPERGTLARDEFARCVGPKTRLVAVGAASNVLGTVNDLGFVAELAERFGALLFVDAVHYAAHGPIDVRRLRCDFLACSAYKFYGPHVGFLYTRRDRLEALDVPKVEPAPDHGPERLELGTQNHEGIAGFTAAVDFLADLATGSSRRARLASALIALREGEHAQLERLWEGLSRIRGVRLYGPPPDESRTPTVSFTMAAIPAATVARALAQRDGVYVSHGDFYAKTLVARLGHASDGLVRVGCAAYTSDEDVARLLAGVGAIASGAELLALPR